MRAKKREVYSNLNITGASETPVIDTEHADDLVLLFGGTGFAGDITLDPEAVETDPSPVFYRYDSATISIAGLTTLTAVRIPGPFTKLTRVAIGGTFTAALLLLTVYSVSHGSVGK